MTIPAIIQLAAEAWHSTPEAVTGKSRVLHHCRARRLAMYLVRETQDLSCPAVGELLSVDSSTVQHACQMMRRSLSGKGNHTEARKCREAIQKITDSYPTPTPPSAGR